MKIFNKSFNTDALEKKIKSFFSFEDSASYVLLYNKIISIIILIISIVVIYYYILKNLFLGHFLFGLFLILIAPLIFFSIKYLCSIYIMVIDWLNSSTKYYKQSLNKNGNDSKNIWQEVKEKLF